ncbi:MAG: glycosyltransferase family 2 protein [Chloroflexi bacterium]|nr:glycosyltransferase family 2 protein [Chloroflexota bacterium]
MSRTLSEIPEQLPKVAAIIVNWNSQADTLECVASLRQSTYTNLDVIVVDNGSTDGSVSAVRSQFPGVAVIENDANLGFGAACNVGIAHAVRKGADYLFLLNSDLKIDPAAIGELVAVCEGDPRIGVAGPIMYVYSKPDTIQAFGGMIELTRAQVRSLYEFQVDRVQLPAVQEVTFIGGGIMFLRRGVIERIGGYDSTFFLYGEEVDLEMRAIQAGYKLIVSARAKVWHKMYGSFGGRPNARVKYNYFRSWAILGRRYLHGWKFVVFCIQYFINRLLRFVTGCVLRGTLDLIGPAMRGAYDGMREERAHHPAPTTLAHAPEVPAT